MNVLKKIKSKFSGQNKKSKSTEKSPKVKDEISNRIKKRNILEFNEFLEQTNNFDFNSKNPSKFHACTSKSCKPKKKRKKSDDFLGTSFPNEFKGKEKVVQSNIMDEEEMLNTKAENININLPSPLTEKLVDYRNKILDDKNNMNENINKDTSNYKLERIKQNDNSINEQNNISGLNINHKSNKSNIHNNNNNEEEDKSSFADLNFDLDMDSLVNGIEDIKNENANIGEDDNIKNYNESNNIYNNKINDEIINANFNNSKTINSNINKNMNDSSNYFAKNDNINNIIFDKNKNNNNNNNNIIINNINKNINKNNDDNIINKNNDNSNNNIIMNNNNDKIIINKNNDNNIINKNNYNNKNEIESNSKSNTNFNKTNIENKLNINHKDESPMYNTINKYKNISNNCAPKSNKEEKSGKILRVNKNTKPKESPINNLTNLNKINKLNNKILTPNKNNCRSNSKSKNSTNKHNKSNNTSPFYFKQSNKENNQHNIQPITDDQNINGFNINDILADILKVREAKSKTKSIPKRKRLSPEVNNKFNNMTMNNINKMIQTSPKNKFDNFDINKMQYEAAYLMKRTIPSNIDDFYERQNYYNNKKIKRNEIINYLINNNIPKLKEEERQKAFNRLIKDGERREELFKKKKLMELNEQLKNKKNKNKTTKKFNIEEFNERYERNVVQKLKHKEELLQEKRLLYKKLKELNEQKILDEMSKYNKKADNKSIEDITNRLYNENQIEYKKQLLNNKKMFNMIYQEYSENKNKCNSCNYNNNDTNDNNTNYYNNSSNKINTINNNTNINNNINNFDKIKPSTIFRKINKFNNNNYFNTINYKNELSKNSPFFNISDYNEFINEKKEETINSDLNNNIYRFDDENSDINLRNIQNNTGKNTFTNKMNNNEKNFNNKDININEYINLFCTKIYEAH